MRLRIGILCFIDIELLGFLFHELNFLLRYDFIYSCIKESKLLDKTYQVKFFLKTASSFVEDFIMFVEAETPKTTQFETVWRQDIL